MYYWRRTALALLTALSAPALGDPISLICTADFKNETGEPAQELHHLYIDIEENEMLYGGPDVGDWIVLEDMKVNKVSVTGTWFMGGSDIYTIYTVDRTDLEMKYTLYMFDDSEDMPDAKCEIADFKIETAF